MKISIMNLYNKKIIENLLKQILNKNIIIAHKNNHMSTKLYKNKLY